VRITRSASGIGVDGASNGRGAWVCRGSQVGELVDAACLDAAIGRGAFARAWRSEVTRDDEAAIRASCESDVEHEDESDAQ
jgi:predicted RNA-binding protein YlxR (DUF448 family)